MYYFYLKKIFIFQSNEIVHYLLIEQKVRNIFQNEYKIYAALYILNEVIQNFNRNDDNSQLVANLCHIWINDEIGRTLLLFNNLTQLFNGIFSVINKSENYELGYELFSHICALLPENVFYNALSYLMYFAYLLKRTDGVALKVKETFFYQLSSKQYKDSYDFCLMNFYKGSIFLYERVY